MTNDSQQKENRLSDAEQARREFVKIAGKLALYTPPVLMLLSKPTPNAIAASAGATGTNESDPVQHEANSDPAQNEANSNLVQNQPNYAPQQQHHGFWLWRLLGLSD